MVEKNSGNQKAQSPAQATPLNLGNSEAQSPTQATPLGRLIGDVELPIAERPRIISGLSCKKEGCVSFVDVQGDLGTYRGVDNPIIEIFRAAEQYIRGMEQKKLHRSARSYQNFVRYTLGDKHFVAKIAEPVVFTPISPVYKDKVTRCEIFASNYDRLEQVEFEKKVEAYISKIAPVFDGMLQAFCFEKDGFQLYHAYLAKIKETDTLMEHLKAVEDDNPRPELVRTYINYLIQVKNELAVECNLVIKRFIKDQGFELPKARPTVANNRPSREDVRNLLRTSPADQVFKQIIKKY